MNKTIKLEIDRLIIKKNTIAPSNMKGANGLSNSIKKYMKDNKSGNTFSKMVFFYINQKKISSSEIYLRSLIDRRTFSKLNNPSYNPSKETAIALSIGLRLSLFETNSMLALCGYTLNKTQDFDIIISYFIEHNIYDIFTINEYLNDYQTDLLGSGQNLIEKKQNKSTH